jgi:succinyl-CoA synthetase beta subunit
MAKFGVRVQDGIMADSAADAVAAAKELSSKGAAELVIKAQIHAGGRGKGHFLETGYKGGVHITSDAAKVGEFASEMLGKSLVTKQTPPEGQMVKKVLVHEGINFGGADEKYFAIIMDRDQGGPVIVVSKQGGMDIEEVHEKDPSAVQFFPVDINEGITDVQAGAAADALGFDASVKADAIVQIKNMYNMFIKLDCTQVEINPFVLATNGKIYCVDAKLNFDDNAAFRQKEVFALRDTSMEDPREVAASEFNLNYVGLDGNIGCMVNGAGLAMATMDIIKLHGGWPANFLDVGGGATAKQVEEAFKILTADPKVQALLVNIFGGIMKCDVIAEGIITAARNINLKVPLVVRLEGTNVEKGIKMLADSGLPIISATNLDEAAKKAVQSIA